MVEVLKTDFDPRMLQNVLQKEQLSAPEMSWHLRDFAPH